jgi:hypothetical protein
MVWTISILTFSYHLYKKGIGRQPDGNLKQKGPICPLRLGGVWMVGVRG